MNVLAFWKNWIPSYRRLFWAGAVLASLTIVYVWITASISPAPTIKPVQFQQLEPMEILVRQIQVGIISVGETAENYLIFERVLGGALQPDSFAPIAVLLLMFAGLVMILAVLTTLTRFWFFAGMGLFILILASLRLNGLQLFGFTGNLFFVIVSTSYAFVGYYFVFIRSAAPFVTRLLVFLLISVLWTIIIHFFSGIPTPFQFISAHGITACVILTIIFIFMVAHEIIAAFITIVSRGETPTRSLRHFLLITAIYFVNLGLLFADKKHIIRWDFFPLSIFLLITISGVLGLWGFRQREFQYEPILKVNPFGVYLFLALAWISFGTMGYLLASANDPPVQLIKDAILYSHLGYGFIFFAYIIANFITMLGKNLAVHKVLYKPQTMPYFTFRLAGLIATFAFFAYTNWQVSVNQLYAGYYNAVGDIFLTQDSLSVAQNYYERSVYFATRNYHAHYALAQIHGRNNDDQRMTKEFDDLAFGRPLDLAYLNWSQTLEYEHNYEKAANILRSGLKDFPKSGYLLNALGLISAKRQRGDSALLLVQQARNFQESKKHAETNLAGLSAKFMSTVTAESLMNKFDMDVPGTKNNLLALASSQGVDLHTTVDIGTDTVINVYTAAAINNYLVGRRGQADTSYLNKVKDLGQRQSNVYYRDFLMPVVALAYYDKGMKSQAFKILRAQAYQGRAGKDYDRLGVWAIEQGAPHYAIHFLDEAINLNVSDARFHRTIAVTEAGDLEQAASEWTQLLQSQSQSVRIIAEKMVRVLKASQAESLGLTDEEKYEYSRHFFDVNEGVEWESFIRTITDGSIRAKAIVDRTKKLDELDEGIEALKVFSLVKTITMSDKKVYDEITHLDLRFLAQQGQWQTLQEQLNADLAYSGQYANDRIYFEALLNAQAGKTKEASDAFGFLLQSDPFNEDAIIAGLSYFDQTGIESLFVFSRVVFAMESNPDSPKLLKEHVLRAWKLGFDEVANASLARLKSVVPADNFVNFMRENPEMFQPVAH